MGKSFKIKNPYPQAGEQYITERTAKINPDSEGNTDLKDGRSKSSAFQNIYKGGGSYKTPGSKKSKKII